MTDSYEIDFLSVGEKSSGDAILIKVTRDGETCITLVDGGYAGTTDNIHNYLKIHYGSDRIDHIVLTHGDQDHISGIIKIIELGAIEIGCLWMLKPWDYVQELLDIFPTRSDPDYLRGRLRNDYPSLFELEKLAIKNSIPIKAPFANQNIGFFTVLSPTKDFYLEMIGQSARTPSTESKKEAFRNIFESAYNGAVRLLSWGAEDFKAEDTSPENNTSVIQYGDLNGSKFLFTGDSGKKALIQALEHPLLRSSKVPLVDHFQIPHHGSRRNLSSEILDVLFGPRIDKQKDYIKTFTAIVSAAKKDSSHPKNTVVRAVIHRGGEVFTTKNGGYRKHYNAPERKGWKKAIPLIYPTATDKG